MSYPQGLVMSDGCPFGRTSQLNDELDSSCSTLPGHPRVDLRNQAATYSFLERELWPADLERIWRKLWWMSKVDSGNISPLHRQAVKSRKIVVTEDPRLHLVWIQDRIFVKPFPRYLSSHKFWADYFPKTQPRQSGRDGRVSRLRGAALGFLRSYFYLIKHESDFRIAQEPLLGLIPPDVTWERFCRFSASFGDICNNDVSGRYQFGEIRLTRLNFYAPLLLRQTEYHRTHHQYSQYFGRFVGPMLFLFGFLSVILSSLQVATATIPSSYVSWSLPLFFWSSIIVIFLILALALILIVIFLFKVSREWYLAIGDWRKAVLSIEDNVRKTV
ncbi:hypothetical protein QBC33DRAFT_484262 [Phialemonium atrogriseum]|uniref:Subtilisin-like serine protease n=1 Tax=Phialemonium atrogriseum TaxID=1093897 RepID=A0AAJ0CAB7_9PEZI|nr:uncharacterized protein QBC33DRAFT_484262 [Phialemonium atrogriseum]KAK1772876.1 hypothetical protein QBC33DRAFT_484262 [Phialemonium atrogriseum]